MNITENLNRLIQAKADIKAAIESKGGVIEENTTLDLYAPIIEGLELGDSTPPIISIPKEYNDSFNIPEGVVLYDYIETTGTLWINTKISVTPSSDIKLFFELDIYDYANDYAWMGIDGILLCKIDSNYIGDGEKSFLVSGKTKVWYNTKNGTSTLTVGSEENTHSRTWNYSGIIYIFKMCNYSSNLVLAKLYNYQILQNNILILNLIPCTYNNIPGMWDTVSNTFFGNNGTGEFIVGNKIELKQYEYIESTNSYIDTKVNISDDKYILEGKTFTAINSNTNYIGPFGDYVNEDTNTTRIISNGNNSSLIRVYYRDTAGDGGTLLECDLTLLIEYKLSYNLIILNNITYSLNKSLGNSNTLTLKLLIANINSSSVNIDKLWYFKIYYDNELIRNFIPCSYNDEYGLWDSVNLLFYGNSGTGEFTVGELIIEYKEIQESNNTYTYDKGILTLSDTDIVTYNGLPVGAIKVNGELTVINDEVFAELTGIESWMVSAHTISKP